MIYNLDGLFGISFSVEQALRTMMGSIIALIFSLIDYLYNVFIYVSKVNILDNDFVQSIYSKVGMILGIFMLFKLVFSLIQSLIDPDKFTDKKNGFASIVSRAVIAIVLLGITPTIFKEAFKLQNLIVGGKNSDNVIYKLIVGNKVGNLDNMGRVLASDLYFSFFTDNEAPNLKNGVKDDIYDSNTTDSQYYDRFKLDDYENLVTDVKNSNRSFQDTVSYLALKNETTNQYVIEFNWFILLIVGGFTVYVLAVYCIQVAIRVVQLAYLQLIAPVPILSYISDPDGAFQKWLKQCISTFLDLFIRLAVIYFAMSLINDVLNQFNYIVGVVFSGNNISSLPLLSINSFGIYSLDVTGLEGAHWTVVGLVKIFIILGILLFASKLPNLIKDLFPSLSGAGKFDFGLNLGKVFKDTYAAKALGGVGGALAGGAVGLIGGGAKGLIGGLWKGATGGLSGKKISDITKERAAQNVKNRQMRRDGSTFFGRMDANFRQSMGLESRVEQIDTEIKDFEKTNIKPLKDEIEQITTVDIRGIDDQIYAIDNSPEYVQKRQNDSVIAAQKAMADEAERELLKNNSMLRRLKLRTEHLASHIGEYDEGLKRTITTSDVLAAEDTYRVQLDADSKTWIDSHSSGPGANAVIARNMQIISDQTGTTVTTAADADSAASTAKASNASNASRIASLESQREGLVEQKRGHERDIEELNRQVAAEEKRKEGLEKKKKKPQADIDAIK